MGILVQLWFAGSQLRIQDGPYRENVLDLEVLPKLFWRSWHIEQKKKGWCSKRVMYTNTPPEPGVLYLCTHKPLHMCVCLAHIDNLTYPTGSFYSWAEAVQGTGGKRTERRKGQNGSAEEGTRHKSWVQEVQTNEETLLEK